MPPRLDMANFRQAFVPGGASTTIPVSPISPIPSASEALSPNPTLPATSATTNFPSSSPSDAATSSSPSSTPSQPQPQESQSQQSVVPVIVVGLQSVNSDWRSEMPPTDDNDMDVFGHPRGGGAEAGGHEIFGDDDDFDGFGNNQQVFPDEAGAAGAGRGRGEGHGGRTRGWQSRAANAIRNLRPGRRPAPPGTENSATAPGSRTFLIYVIGGQYFLREFIDHLSSPPL